MMNGSRSIGYTLESGRQPTSMSLLHAPRGLTSMLMATYSALLLRSPKITASTAERTDKAHALSCTNGSYKNDRYS